MKAASLDIVVPVFNEADNLAMLKERLTAALAAVEDMSWRLLLVDDGSTDGSWEAIEALVAQDSHVEGIRLSRNYGHQHALLAGLEHSNAEAVITMDADLQHPPECLPELITAWQGGSMIVNTRRQDPAEWGMLKRWSSALYYRLFSFLSGVHLEPGMADFRLLDRRVVAAVTQFREQTLFLRGVVQVVGFSQSILTYRGAARETGTTKFTFRRMLCFARDGIFSFSLMPLRLATVVGVLTALLAFCELIYAVSIRLFTERSVPGWASGIAVVSLMFGIQFILLGVIGEYLGNVLIEARGRPRYLVMQTASSAGDATAPTD